MKFNFDNYDEYRDMWECAHSAILYWKKVRQNAEGKICLQVDGSDTHYNVIDANIQMMRNAKLLRDIEECGPDESQSQIIDWCLRQDVNEVD